MRCGVATLTRPAFMHTADISYGGGFTVGAGSTYISPFLIQRAEQTKRPVILVTFNYRLGIFGFGYGEDIAEAGAANLALRDQLLALRWVKDNIASFGGDPSKVSQSSPNPDLRRGCPLTPGYGVRRVRGRNLHFAPDAE